MTATPPIPQPDDAPAQDFSRLAQAADWSDFVPEQERTTRRRRRQRAQLNAMLRDRKALIRICLGTYLSLCLALLLTGQLLLTAYALLPVLLTPPLGYMMYWLVWKEFHE
jgi:hypothetical protein